MISFGTQMLHALAQFLSSEPIIYLFGLVLLVFVVRTIKLIIS